MDELDALILSELQQAYSLTPKVTEIAKKLRKSSTTIHSRIKRLERQGVIRGYSAMIDPEALGKKLSAFYFIKTSRGKDALGVDDIIKQLLNNPNIRKVHDTMGEWDLVAEFVGRDVNDYISFMRDTEPLNGIEATKGKTILRTFSGDFKVLPE